jgi:D-alanyl-D-alanine carboxypeptidase (penicillin-binding protein 5/6)
MLICILHKYTLPAASKDLNITANAALLMDVQTGTVLYAKEAHGRRPPASTTKIMSGILALELGNLDDLIVVSQNAAYTEGSSMCLRVGEIVTLNDLIHGALLQSGNDACVAIGEHLCGSEKVFVELMNRKARAMGAWDTNFKNPHGLPAEGHYTTAFDLALMARYALGNGRFREIVQLREKTITGPMGGRENLLLNTNALLWDYEGADGVKTGSTAQAGQCLVASATRGRRQLLTVVLNSQDRWSDAVQLLDYGFSDFSFLLLGTKGQTVTQIPVLKGEEGKLDLVLARDLNVAIPEEKIDCLAQRIVLSETPTAPIYQGETLGEIQVTLKGKVVKRIPLVAKKTVEKTMILQHLLRNLF